MNQEAPPIAPLSSPAPSHKDRRTGLIVFGILQILLGLACLGIAALIPVSMNLSAQTGADPMPFKMMVPGLLMYLGWGVMFIWLGIGSMNCRRWARAITLIYSWIWLLMGLVMVPLMIWLLPQVMQSTVPPQGEEIPEGMMQIIIITQIVIMTVIFIVIPGITVLFYRSRHVLATCETRDPVSRWTDRCPLPLLAIALMMWWSTLIMLCLAAAGFAIVPFFGTLLSGLNGSILMAAIAAFMFWAGLTCYRQKIAGWWALVGFMPLFAISSYLTFTKIDVFEIYERIGYPEDQIEVLRQQDWLTSDFMAWNSVIWVLPVLLYFLWARRFFRTTTPAG